MLHSNKLSLEFSNEVAVPRNFTETHHSVSKAGEGYRVNITPEEKHGLGQQFLLFLLPK